jgi:NAD(P)-dependent dehydrogenase (short-subunit alcohol dehydrogenase family)
MSTILVTGGNRGIGFGIVQAIATRLPSSTVLIGCRSISAGEKSIQKLQDLGIKTRFDTIHIDIEDDDSIANAVVEVNKRYGRLDGKCLRIAEHPSRRYVLMSPKSWSTTLPKSTFPSQRIS